MKKKFYYISLKSTILILLLVCFQNITAQQFDSITDSRDGQKYKVVKIGNQWWMAQNLNYYTPAGSAHYNYNSITYSNIYGRLYSWTIANQTCPSEWHLSTHDDWKKLENYLGVSSSEYKGIGEHYYIGTNQGGILKDTVLWKLPNTGAQNSVGFSVIPAGLIRELVTSNKNY